MFASLLDILGGGLVVLLNPVSLAVAVFQIWMFIHAIRNKEWIWALLIIAGFGISCMMMLRLVVPNPSRISFSIISPH